MLRSQLFSGGLRRFSSLGALTALALLWAGPAEAHLVLKRPASWVVQDGLGNPQKDAPCGGENGGIPSGIVTTYRAGSIIDVEWQETVGHPGHFRISVAEDREDLVDPPVQTSNGDGVSGNSLTTVIQEAPRYPVLADGLHQRGLVLMPEDESFIEPVQLPDTTCERCTLQVIQFMANHVPGYFYHHCADIRIVSANEDVPDEGIVSMTLGSAGAGDATAGAAGGSSAGMAGPDASSGGCSLPTRLTHRPGSSVPWLLLGVGAALWRRRAVS